MKTAFGLNLTGLLLALVLGSANIAQAQTDPKQEKAALEKAQNIRQQLLQGADFEEMAKKYSEDPGSALHGGELGFVRPGDFVPEYEKAAMKLKAGEISKPVRSKFGYHIIQMVEKKEDLYRTRHILIRI